MNFNMERNHASKIVLLFLAVTSIFALLEKLGSIVLISDINASNKDTIEHFLKINLLWLITVILIILVLITYIKKADGKFNLIFIYNYMIRFTSGLLIILDGIIKIVNKVSVLLSNIQAFHQAEAMLGEKATGTDLAITSNIIPICIYFLQILSGLYFIRNKKQTNK